MNPKILPPPLFHHPVTEGWLFLPLPLCRDFCHIKVVCCTTVPKSGQYQRICINPPNFSLKVYAIFLPHMAGILLGICSTPCSMQIGLVTHTTLKKKKKRAFVNQKELCRAAEAGKQPLTLLIAGATCWEMRGKRSKWCRFGSVLKRKAQHKAYSGRR